MGFYSKFTMFLTVVVLTTKIAAQDASMYRGAGEATLPSVVNPSPNSSSLIRTISENVDLYTGKLSVNLPLYDLKARDIEIPISLSSNVNAHQINDVGSWVGLGWNLNAGGVITRVMKSLPDEYNGVVSSDFNKTGIGFLNLFTNEGVCMECFSSPLDNFTAASLTDMTNTIHHGCWNGSQDNLDKYYDLEPDEFYFQFAGFSGKFVFNKSGTPILTTEANLKITTTISSGKITGFTVTDDRGYKYDFGGYNLNAVEETKMKTHSLSALYAYRYIGLYKMVKPTVRNTGPLQRVNFLDAQTGPFKDPIPMYAYETIPYVMSMNPPDLSRSTNSNYTPPYLLDFANQGDQQKNQEFCTYPSSWFLTKITSPNGNIVNLNYEDNGTLTYLADRSWSQNSPAFIGGTTVNYGYMPPGFSADPYVWGGWFGGNDYWPYSSSPNVGFSIVAPVWRFPNPNPGPSSPGAMMSYPTFGGRTYTETTIELKSKRLKEIVADDSYKIEFLANTPRKDLTGDKRLDKISVQYNGSIVKEFLFNYDEVNSTEPTEVQTWPGVYKPVFYYDGSGYFNHAQATPYNLTYNPSLESSVKWRMFLTSVTESGSTGITIPSYKFDYYNKTDLPFRTSFKHDMYGFANNASDLTHPNYTDMLAGVLRSITYPTGGYKEFILAGSGNTASWNGLRISQIKEMESATSTTPIEKNYTYSPYQDFDHATIYYDLPDYARLYTDINSNTPLLLAGSKNFYSSSRNNPEMGTHGSPGGYSYVEEWQSGNGIHRTEFLCSENPDVPNPVMVASSLAGFVADLSALGYTYPFPNYDQMDWKRGLPIHEYFKDASGKTIKSIDYDYDFDNETDLEYSTALKVAKYRIDFGSGWNWCVYGRYLYRPRWQLLKSKVEKDYGPDGISSISNASNFYYKKINYNGKNYLYLDQKINLSNSKGEQLVQKIKYPLDYANAIYPYDTYGLGITNLKNKNILSAPIETYQYVQDQAGNNKRYIAGTINYYDAQSPVIKSILTYQPPGISTSFTESNTNSGSFNLDANYKSVVDFHKYNANGQILEQSKTNNQREAYLWDYQSTYPVAKVTNASFNDIAYTSFEADGTFFSSTGLPLSIVSTDAHTGVKSYRFNAGNPVYGPTQDLVPSQKSKYTFSCWVKTDAGFGTAYLVLHTSNPTGDAGTVFPQNAESYKTTTITNTNGQWKYFEVTLDLDKVKQLSGITQTLRLRAYVYNVDASHGFAVDDYRLCPSDALMTTYTYSPLIGMTSTTDPNNRTTYYDYDGMGRLSVVKDQNGKILKKYCYNYAGQQEQCYFYESAAIDADYYPQNCSSAIAYHVTVPKGMFTSYVDQPSADQLAQQYAQDQANQYGTCLAVPVYGENNSGGTFTLKLHNVASEQDYPFTVTGQSAATLGDVPPGSYDITITPPSGMSYFYFSVGCGYSSDSMGEIKISGIDINSSCNSIIID